MSVKLLPSLSSAPRRVSGNGRSRTCSSAVLIASVLAALVAAGGGASTTRADPSPAPGAQQTVAATVAPAARKGWRHTTAYRKLIRFDRPTRHIRGRWEFQQKRRIGRSVNGYRWTRMPNGTRAPRFSGNQQFLRFPSSPRYSIATTGKLTVEYWIRPDTLQFRDEEGSGYVYILGKGRPGAHEWYARMYSKRNRENRPNRLSGYAFNPSGGLGSGSYVQDPVRVGRWIHLVLVYNTSPSSGAAMGTVALYKNGRLRDRDSLADYNIRPRAGRSPFRIGTGYRDSYFQGAIGDVVFFNRTLGPRRILAHYRAMFR